MNSIDGMVNNISGTKAGMIAGFESVIITISSHRITNVTNDVYLYTKPRCDEAIIEPMHRNKANITYLFLHEVFLQQRASIGICY